MPDTYSADGVRNERTNWRCQDISARHRKWGYNCPAVDLDFVVAEYNHGKPVALIEYKERHALKPNLDHPTYQALSDLADNYRERALPFFVAIYDRDDWWFKVIPVNECAKAFYRHISDDEFLTEQRFVKSLYWIRGLSLTGRDKEAVDKLNTILPDNA